MGLCFTFHPQSYIHKHGALMSNRAGSIGGLKLDVNIEQHEYIVGSMAAGIQVITL